MGRLKKDGKRATGIQGKKGFLYIVSSHPVKKDGIKKSEKKWISTGLSDTPENVKKAIEIRRTLLNRNVMYITDRNITFSDYIDIILRNKKREVSDTTYSAYCQRANHIKHFFKKVKVKEIDETLVEAFLDDLFITRHLQQRTVKDIKVFLGLVLEEATKEGLVSYNPSKNVIINKNLAVEYSKEKNTDDEFFSYEEAQLFLFIAKDHPLYELFYVSLFFGLRREEVLGLRWAAINFKDKTMRINHTVTKGTKINRSNSTKTESSNRLYPLTDEQIEMFINLRKKEDDSRRLFGKEYVDNDYIFKHIDGSLFYPDYPTKAFGKLIKKHPELPQRITLHGLRSSCVSILIHQGLDVKSIQKWVGHADIDTTLRIYAKVKDKETKKEVSEAMTDIISLKTYTK